MFFVRSSCVHSFSTSCLRSTPQITSLPVRRNTHTNLLLLMAPISIVCMKHHLFNPPLVDIWVASSFCYYKYTYIYPYIIVYLCRIPFQRWNAGSEDWDFRCWWVFPNCFPKSLLPLISTVSERTFWFTCWLSSVVQPRALDNFKDQHWEVREWMPTDRLSNNYFKAIYES